MKSLDNNYFLNAEAVGIQITLLKNIIDLILRNKACMLRLYTYNS